MFTTRPITAPSTVITRAAEVAGTPYGRDHETDVRLRVVGDHVRSALMLMTDGVTPGNEARGYVLRRLLRRSIRSMRLLGVHDPVLPELLPVSKSLMEVSYPEIISQWQRVSQAAYAEEDSFRRTLASGTQIFDLAATAVKQRNAAVLEGDKAFQLHDTYGFPIDLTLEMAAEAGLAVDQAEFRRLMTEAGFEVNPPSAIGPHPITPIMFPGEDGARLATSIANHMLGAGVYVIAFSFPVVPRGKARIRVMNSAAHSQADLEQALGA